MDEYQKKMFCPSCGQKLLTATTDLRDQILCPRCQNVYVLKDIIDRLETLKAVRVGKAKDACKYDNTDSLNHHVQQHEKSFDHDRKIDVQSEAQHHKPQLLSRLPEEIYQQSEIKQNDSEEIPTTEYPVPTKRKGINWIKLIKKAFYWMDSKIHKQRLNFLFVGALIVFLTQCVNLRLEMEWIEILIVVIFMFEVILLFVSWILSFQDEEGRFRKKIITDKLKSTLSLLGETYDFLKELPKEEIGLLLSKYVAVIFTIGLGFRAVFGLFPWLFRWLGRYGLYESMMTFFTLLFGIGFILGGMLFLAFKLIIWDKKRKTKKEFSPNIETTRQKIGDLPYVLDFINEYDSAIKSSKHINDPLMNSLLFEIANWKPRKKNALEAYYQGSLFRYLKIKFPNVDLEREYYLRLPESRGRRFIDLVVAGFVAIEMKRDLKSASNRDRAAGQLRVYSENWREKGPVILLVCQADHGFLEREFSGIIRHLRDVGHSVVCVVAGHH